MRKGVLLYLVLRLVVGLFMLMHALYSIVTFNAFTLKLIDFLGSAKMFENEFFSIVAPLFPFIEFALGSFILLGLYYKNALVLSIVISLFISVLLISKPAGSGILIAVVLFVLCSILLYKSKEYMNPRRSQNLTIEHLR